MPQLFISSMTINKYRKSETASRMWLVLAIFLLIFNSTPVKKYIRLQLYKHGAAVELNGAEHVSICNHGDCTLLDRHEISNKVYHIIAQPSDTDILLFITAVLSGVCLLFFRKQRNNRTYPEHSDTKGTLVPLYLHICKLQV